MLGVAEYMRERAPDYKLNPEEMYVLGFLHDIGYLKGRERHEVNGAKIVRNMGVDERFASAIEFHDCIYGVSEEHRTKEMVLLIEADSSVNAEGYIVGFDKRTTDVARRYGNAKFIKENIEYVENYCKKHKIKQPREFYKNMKTKKG